MKTSSRIEWLESRIAPASLSGNILTYTDFDGDAVTITFKTKGQLAPANFTFDTAFESTGNQQLQLIDLRNLPDADGTSIGVSVTAGPGGNGRADIGFINAQGIDLGKVNVAGDLGRIVAGDTDTTAAIKSLVVHSMGVAGLATQGAGGSLASVITGSVGSIRIAENFSDASISLPVLEGRGTKIGSLFIGGDLEGGDLTGSGAITVSGSVGKVAVQGSIEGGSGSQSGVVSAGAISSVTIGKAPTGPRGDAAAAIQGGTGTNSGVISALNSIKKVVIFGAIVGDAPGSGSINSTQGGIGSISIQGSLVGGDGDRSGSINTELAIGRLSVSLDLIGGAGASSGSIEGAGGIGSATIGQDIRGGSNFNAGTITSQRGIETVNVKRDVVGGTGMLSGAIRPDGFLLNLVIGGNLTGSDGDQSGIVHAGLIQNVTIGNNLTAGTGLRSGMIESDNSIASVKIGGDAIGGASVPATIVARGAFKPTKTADVAIGSVQIGGRAEFLNVLAGFDETSVLVTQQLHPGVNGNAQIRSIKIGATAAGLNIVAGVLPGIDGAFGTTDDAPYGDFTDRIDPLIGKLTVTGQWLATGATDDSFVVTADRVLRASVNRTPIPLSATDDAEIVDLSADSKLIEFA